MRERLQVDERRAQLLELGLSLFGSRSYEDISIHDIAAEAGISKGLLYHYFNGKRGFYVATIDHAADRLVEAIEPDMTLPEPARSTAALVAYFDYVEARADAYMALMHGGLGADTETLAIVERVRGAVVQRILDGLELTEPRPVFRMAARSWVGAAESASLDWLRHKTPARQDLVTVLMAQLYICILTATRLDPEAGVTLDPALAAPLL